MPGEKAFILNDDLFQRTIGCPLKFIHITQSQEERKSSGLLFRQRNKLHVRDAIARHFHNCRHTSNATPEAKEETEEWLKEDSVAICGAVIYHENFLTRIPILLKEDTNLTIIQIHGKLRKRSEGDVIPSSIKKRNIVRYLLKAAFRVEVVRRCFPESDIDVDFYFPNKHFKSSFDHLHLFSSEKFGNDGNIQQEFAELFSKVKATKAVKEINQNIPESVAHKNFVNQSVAKAIRDIVNINKNQSEKVNVKRHSGCKYCEFRLPETEHLEGCWDKFFSSENIQHPEKHIFELIGQGNSTETENGTFYQEEAELSRGFRSFEDTQKYGGPNITILQRRNLQILQARDEPVPSLWIKQGANSIIPLSYPLHFIDFEAATYALPMKKKSTPYKPVYFQFSCHTLYKNGDLVHTEWLDQQDGKIHPHEEFVNQLGMIPDIFKGTMMQFSPFEKQGVNRLIHNFEVDPDRYQSQIQVLKNIRSPELQGQENRFFDMSRIIRDYYFNKFFNDGLGLKQVLSSVLEWEKSFGSEKFPKIEIGEMTLDINDSLNEDKIPDPYKKIQNPDYLITDGSAAMNAWLAFKNGLLTDEEKVHIPKILKKYCALDSFALYVIYRHIEKFIDKFQDEDLIIF